MSDISSVFDTAKIMNIHRPFTTFFNFRCRQGRLCPETSADFQENRLKVPAIFDPSGQSLFIWVMSGL
jgi:hypothetical protein